MEIKNAVKQVKNKVNPLTGGVVLTDGRLKQVFDNNISFLKRFDVDRMLYWFRVSAGKYASGAPYGFDGGHFENNLHGQTAGQFLMGAGSVLLWQEDEKLRQMLNAVVDGIEECRKPDGFLIPVPYEEFDTKENPNYLRAWLTFGLLSAGYAGNSKAFKLVRDMGDWFNKCNCLDYVKDLNLGFQGILANTALYLSPVGVEEDLEVAQKYYREDWWLKQLKDKNHRAIYQHPGNHPHGTLLTTLEGYFDIYLATGEKFLLECIQSAMSMYEDKWQHVGGGIVMCEYDRYYPGCNFLSMSHKYNELCCSTFWVMLNQRMHLLSPDDEHYVNEIEKSIYNVLVAAQVDDIGIHYLAFLEGSKDLRFADIATCCAGTGSRLMALLPQFLYTYNDNDIYVDMYSSSTADINGTRITCKTDLPYSGRVEISIEASCNPVRLHLRIPSWCSKSVDICGKEAEPGSYFVIDNVKAGDTFTFTLPFGFKATKYSGAEEIPGKSRYALEYGPLLLAAMGRGGVELHYDINNPEEWLTQITKNRFRLKDSNFNEFMAYMDITDQPLTVYPVVK